MKFQSKYKKINSRKYIWKYRLRNGSHFVQGRGWVTAILQLYGAVPCYGRPGIHDITCIAVQSIAIEIASILWWIPSKHTITCQRWTAIGPMLEASGRFWFISGTLWVYLQSDFGIWVNVYTYIQQINVDTIMKCTRNTDDYTYYVHVNLHCSDELNYLNHDKYCINNTRNIQRSQEIAFREVDGLALYCAPGAGIIFPSDKVTHLGRQHYADPWRTEYRQYIGDVTTETDNVTILMTFSSMVAPKVVILTTFGAISDEKFIKMIFPFQWPSVLNYSRRFNQKMHVNDEWYWEWFG